VRVPPCQGILGVGRAALEPGFRLPSPREGRNHDGAWDAGIGRGVGRRVGRSELGPGFRLPSPREGRNHDGAWGTGVGREIDSSHGARNSGTWASGARNSGHWRVGEEEEEEAVAPFPQADPPKPGFNHMTNEPT